MEAKLLPPKDPKMKDKKTLVIDIEGTLIFSLATDMDTLKKKRSQYDYTLEILNSEDIKIGLGVKMRPSLTLFLQELGKICEIIFWTAGKKSIYQKILDIIDPTGVASHRLFKEYCKHTKFGWHKNLNLLNRDPGTVILIECYSISRDFYPYNTIEIPEFLGDKKDTYLKKLIYMLKYICNKDDIRPVEYWKCMYHICSCFFVVILGKDFIFFKLMR